jgi:dipeptidyl aminopeptidase/acylaminoacyl peptidase
MRFPARASVLSLALSLLPVFVPALAAQKRPFDVDALLRIQRISDPQLSPDGKTVAFAVSVPDVAANKSLRSVWSVALDGGSPRKLADQAERPRWSPDGKRIFYTSGGQVWSMDPDGAAPKQITKLSTGAADHIVSPDGKTLLVHGDVYPSCATADNILDDPCNAHMADEEKSSKVSARVITGLLYRHWTAWQGKTRSHLLAVPVAGGKVVDLTPGAKDVPGF